MAKHKNCPNCGAVYELENYKCPYCGTLYYDMSAIDIDNKEPFFIKIRTNGMIITQLVRASNCSMELKYDDVTCYDKYGREMSRFRCGANMSTNLEFEAVNIPGKNSLVELKCERRIV